MDQIDLSDLFTTKAEANEFVSRIASISDMFFQTGFNLERAFIQHFGVNKADRLLALMRDRNIPPGDLPAAKDFLFALATKIPTIPVITLTVAFEPEEQTLESISEWFLVNMNMQMLFSIIIDRNVVGGATITYNGKFFDFSIKPIFERTLKENMARLETEEAKRLGPPLPIPPQSPQLIAKPAATPGQAATPATTQAVKQDINNITFGR